MIDPLLDRRLVVIEATLRVITELLRGLLQRSKGMADTLDELKADVAAEQTVEASAIALLQGLAAQLAAAGQDPAKLAELHQQITTQTAALAAAVAANTPAPAPAPAPSAPTT